MTTTYIHVHASENSKPCFCPTSARWFLKNIHHWVGEAIQDKREGPKKTIKFCWTKREELENRNLYNSLKHQFFVGMTLYGFDRKEDPYNYAGFVVFSDQDVIHHNYYIIFSNEETEELWDEVEEYDKEVEKIGLTPYGIFIILTEIQTSWYEDNYLRLYDDYINDR